MCVNCWHHYSEDEDEEFPVLTLVRCHVMPVVFPSAGTETVGKHVMSLYPLVASAVTAVCM